MVSLGMDVIISPTLLIHDCNECKLSGVIRAETEPFSGSSRNHEKICNKLEGAELFCVIIVLVGAA